MPSSELPDDSGATNPCGSAVGVVEAAITDAADADMVVSHEVVRIPMCEVCDAREASLAIVIEDARQPGDRYVLLRACVVCYSQRLSLKRVCDLVHPAGQSIPGQRLELPLREGK